MSSTKPPWPATAGLIMVSIRSWTFVFSSSLMALPPLSRLLYQIPAKRSAAASGDAAQAAHPADRGLHAAAGAALARGAVITPATEVGEPQQADLHLSHAQSHADGEAGAAEVVWRGALEEYGDLVFRFHDASRRGPPGPRSARFNRTRPR